MSDSTGEQLRNRFFQRFIIFLNKKYGKGKSKRMNKKFFHWNIKHQQHHTENRYRDLIQVTFFLLTKRYW